MEQARNLGNFALWLSSHLLFTLILDLALLGGWFAWQQLPTLLGRDMASLVKGLSVDEKNELAQALFDNGGEGIEVNRKK